MSFAKVPQKKQFEMKKNDLKEFEDHTRGKTISPFLHAPNLKSKLNKYILHRNTKNSETKKSTVPRQNFNFLLPRGVELSRGKVNAPAGKEFCPVRRFGASVPRACGCVYHFVQGWS